ncbi:hypothetical protein CTAYLR_008875 [Chrysophaeum taylorii]|uniref:N-acetylneuraminate lyase n=1 Tax=Chrysophaeum taylorii TaxID=2483200 RepID=A0AAD7U6M4_9STRA|nr:hypothetical protein CTAYLR_008875 [Chrysophaeum taylorii]
MVLLFLCLLRSVSGVAPLRIDGLVAAVLSPFDAAQQLNASVVAAQREYLRATGVNYVFVCGTTGESVSLTVKEREALLEAWLQTDAGVIAHVGAEAIEDAKALAAHAQARGAIAIGAMPPSYFKPATVEALAHTLAATCAAAPRLPCYYYHIPSMTGVEFAMMDLVSSVEALNVTNFAGVKYTGLDTSPGYKDAQRLVDYADGRYEVFGGREEMMLESLAIGIKGHVGSQFNFLGDLYNGVRTSFEHNGLTSVTAPALRALQLRGIAALEAQTAPSGVNAQKRFMRYAGVDVGDARLPYLPVTDDIDQHLSSSFSSFCEANADLYMCGGGGGGRRRQKKDVYDEIVYAQ